MKKLILTGLLICSLATFTFGGLVQQRHLAYISQLPVFELFANWQTTNQTFTNTQVLSGSAEGVQRGSLTVVDTATGTVKVVSNELEIIGTGVAYQDVGVVGAAITKALGKALFFAQGANASLDAKPGFDFSSILDGTPDPWHIWRRGASNTYAFDASTTDVADITNTQTYNILLLLGGYDSNGIPFKTGDTASNFLYGVRFLIEGGSFGSWTLLWPASNDNASTLYPQFNMFDAVDKQTLDNILIPTAVLNVDTMFQPNFLDTFTGTNDDQLVSDHTPEVVAGAAGTGNPWESGSTTWTIQGNTANNNPTIGAELVTDGGFAAITKAGAKVIAGITAADPGVVTLAAGHGYVNGQVIYIDALDEMVELNTEYWKIRNLSGDTCQLSDAAIGTWDSSSLDTSLLAAETTGGTAQAASFTSWTEGDGWHPGVDGAGALTGTADCDGEQVAYDNLTQIIGALNGAVAKLSSVIVRATGDIFVYVGTTNFAPHSTSGTYVDYIVSDATVPTFFQASPTFIGSIDDVSVKEVTANEIFATDDLGIDEGIFDANLTIPTTNDGYAGIITHLDDKDTPANYVEAIYNRATGKVELNKYVASARTSLINTTATYAAGAQLRVTAYESGSDLLVRLYYNGALIGTEQTISDVGIVGNTRHGIMSVDSSNSVDNYSVMKRTDANWDTEIARATGGIY